MTVASFQILAGLYKIDRVIQALNTHELAFSRDLLKSR
jgi:hypothetical protein